MGNNNEHGHFCEGLVRDLLPEIGIPYKNDRRDGDQEWYWWASKFEDRCLGIDCWITLAGYGEVTVDFTVISERNGELLQQKITKTLERGIVPLVLEQGMLLRAQNGSRQALQDFNDEIRLQIPLKLQQLKGERMTRGLANKKKQERRGF